MRMFSGSIYVVVRNRDSAIGWYKEKFKLGSGSLVEMEEGEVELQSSDRELTISIGGPTDNPVDRAMLATGNAKKAREWLVGHGVSADPIQTDRQGTRYFEIRDLENNPIEIFEEP